MRKSWWKIIAVILVAYTIIAGFLLEAPRLVILNETIRAMHFHVPMWFGMVIMLTASAIFSIRYLRTGNLKFDIYAVELVNISILFGVLGLATGMVWANFTWGEFWSGDPKQNASAIGMLIYLAYILLRNSIADRQQKAKISSVYNIFAYAALIPLLFILPRLTDSLHPGNGGNPGFNAYELDGRLRMVFYPAVIGWSLLGLWMAELRIRLNFIKSKLNEDL
ncbi:cytochrome c biogenesis protein CcsA [Marivirga atlantica]|uniref:Cytochrome c biogenesis protein CcsA n=1 Tax=Marivirga atlantica TaxID=1548457 RepID=A0A937A8D4_9BACT|nr:cytochrome c biogenesis protein CcsA [Marivirga atlantica]MBL0764231.1 cytochrome c biogenesis protein CcsA [Marivirga atlantica]